MNVAVINLKDLGKYTLKILILIGIMLLLSNFLWGTENNVFKKIKITNIEMSRLLSYGSTILSSHEVSKATRKNRNILDLQLAMFTEFRILEDTSQNNIVVAEETEKSENTKVDYNLPVMEKTTVTTETISDRNLAENYNLEHSSVKIRNKTDYELTAEMLNPDVTIENPKNILIYHTHTCESYTPSENYNYTMTGNYRTTDSNYNMIRVGGELSKYLTEKGFNVIHDGTYHDYPSYSGSYDRSFQTATNK